VIEAHESGAEAEFRAGRPKAVIESRGSGSDAELAALAAGRHGLVRVEEAHAVGLTADAVRHRRGRGRLHLIHCGVLAVGHPGLTPHARGLAAVLACGSGALLAARDAAILWELLPPDPEGEPCPPVHVVRDGTHRRAPSGVRLHHVAPLTAADRRVRHGIPVTAPIRTLLDLAAFGSPTDLARAVAEAHARRLVDPGALLRRARHRRGAAALRDLLEPDPTVSRSEAERLLLALVERAGLPRPLTNVRVAGFEVDAFWPDRGLVVEVDGYAFHSSRWAFERDRLRDQAMQAAGHRVLRVTWRQLTRDSMALAVRLARALDTSV